LKIASWNVNSIRARLDHVTGWLTQHAPDVLLLQELKGAEFPEAAFKKLGYESVAVTQKAHNGAAVIDRSIDVHVSNLRRKLGALSEGTERIRAIRNVGYIYARPVTIESIADHM